MLVKTLTFASAGRSVPEVIHRKRQLKILDSSFTYFTYKSLRVNQEFRIFNLVLLDISTISSYISSYII